MDTYSGAKTAGQRKKDGTKTKELVIPPEIRYVKKRFRKGDYIFTGNEENINFYLLMSGSANVIYNAADGGALQIEHFTAPDFFGEIELLTDRREPLPIVASENCETWILSKEETMKWLRKDFDFCLRIMQRLCQKLYACTFRETERHFLPIRERLLLIFRQYERSGSLDSLTKADLCEQLGIPIRSLNRVIAQCSDVMVYEHKHFRKA
ncbi:MAG TPA: Crp/Fnr family transcriptional regulator [Lachnospiraceae bacterium]|nr:Crp/Fnr family transcriptional regulator [Lachnospiraceae bacterium]